ncbi:PAS domain-containing protein [Geobacter sp. SVR]|uniref:PAS domain-containing sensor histidine kinase n=1 Tax=Geobacter sp. SVR TaxID=2495594 RepID=UPI00143EF8B5|nr:PAS domain-containing protein [Geobacter sp. SVR]BCS53537.1 hypothetical protein GSVR_18450 [Geobacter sp. SVR]GCF84266.1 hypothetical protein GSbR_08660 [Geobacter sp. SVR]
MQPSSPVFYDFFRNNTVPQIMIMAGTGRIVQANPAACSYYGFDGSSRNLPCLTDLDTNHPIVTMAELNLAAKGIEHSIRSTHRTVLGEREVRLRTCAADFGPEIFVLATVDDITQQLTREKNVQADEERWRFALSGSGDGVWDWDITSDQPSCSPHWKEMLGYGRHEIGDDIRDWHALIYDEDRDQVTTAYEKILAGGCNRVELEYRMRHKMGDLIWVLARCTVLRWEPDGRPARIITVHSDITLHKKNEAELRSFGETLERVVVQRTEALNLELAMRMETERRLLAFQERLSALTEELCLTEEREGRRLAAWLHDDVGQNLALLKINLDRLSKSLSGGNDRFREMSTLLTATIEEIRARTILISPPVLQKLGLVPALSKLANDMGNMHGFSVHIDAPQPLPELSVSLRSTLYRIVRELLINIVKHAAASHVSLNMSCDGMQLEIRVQDNGQGFDRERHEATATANNSFGLFHVMQRINLLGGAFTIDSAPGRGCVCAIQVPALQDAPGNQDFPD